MARAPQSGSRTNDRIILDLLNSVEVDGARSQRHMAAELGIALGLVNAYLKRCIKKGLVKVSDAPARRYAYYLTRQGFAEKSRLTINYLSASFEFFRRAKADCAHELDAARARGFHQLVLAGKSDLAEVALLCAAESDVKIVAIVDPLTDQRKFAGVAVVPAFADVEADFDAVVVTQVDRAREVFEAAVDACGAERVFVPAMLGIRVQTMAGAGS
jgi:DNA-binding MarR family transcriptional regulator